MSDFRASVRRRGLGLANPWWTTLMLVAVVLANVRFGSPDSKQLGSWAWSPLAVSFVVVAFLPAVLPSFTLNDTSQRVKAPGRLWASTWVAMAIAGLMFGLVVYEIKTKTTAPAREIIGVEELVAVELGGSGQTLPRVDLTTALSWDFALIVGYGTALWMATTAATWVFWTPRAARIARLARWLTVLTVLSDMTENTLLGLAWTHAGAQPVLLDMAAVSATIKFSALLPTAIIAIIGLLVVIGRLMASVSWYHLRKREKKKWNWQTSKTTLVAPAPLELDGLRTQDETELNLSDAARSRQVDFDAASGPDVLRPAGGHEQRWKSAYNVPGIDIETSIPSRGIEELLAKVSCRRRRSDATGPVRGGPDRIGFCLSGGGVRSASLAMGFLQSTRDELRRSKYLVSISGGGYTSGALLMALTTAPGSKGNASWIPAGAPAVHNADTAYMPGTAEYDHLRRHSSYISAGVWEMLVALMVLARGLVVSLVVLFAPAVALGVLFAWIYHVVPLTVLPAWKAKTKTVTGALATTTPGDSLSLPSRVLYAVLAVGVLALVLWLIKIGTQHSHGRLRQWLSAHTETGATFAALATAVIAIVAVGVPVLMWVTRWIGDKVGVSIGVSGSVGVVVLSYLASLASLLWRKRTQLSNAIGGDGEKKSITAAVPRGLLQLLLVIVAFSVLCASWLLLFGAAALAEITAIADGADRSSLLPSVAIVIVVFIIGTVFDQSSLSLHPFYRRRLASAFATRRVQLSNGAPPVAVPYDRHEVTNLSDYGTATPDDGGGYPEVIFAAAANLTGEHRTPSGLSAVSYVMSADWCGGPDVGWVRTSVLEDVSSARLQRDLTVQAAVAISGAAFASAMGRFAGWYQLLLAVTGARLGAWLPNPVFLAQMRKARDENGRVKDWTLPGLPRVRRLTYLLREVFNLHSASDRLLQITDGGHYENLGIVELLRRRCTTIYCIDGGGGSPPTAQGLAEAISLARAELGVIVTLDDPWTTEPGSGDPLSPQAPLAIFNDTLSKDAIVTGTFAFPEASGLPADQRHGRLFVARALLTPGMPYEVLSYAAQHPEFPHDATSDQWFDDGQFNAYTQLGHHLGVMTLEKSHRDSTR